jgi:putative ABC transport system substrate-binding protein
MIRFFLSIVFSLLVNVLPWTALLAADKQDPASVLVIQTFRVPPYEQAVKGFESTFKATFNKIHLTDSPNIDIFSRMEQKQPDLIVAVGQNALAHALPVKDIPIVFLMILDPGADARQSENIYGVSMQVAPDQQIGLMQKTLPWVKSLGFIYDADFSPVFVAKARQASRERNINLVDRKSMDAKMFHQDVKDLSGYIDAFWMLPDVNLLTPENTEILLLLSMEKKIPIITFSEKFLDMGAFMAISVDPFLMGEQAGRLARKVLSGPHPAEKIIPAEKTVLRINNKILKTWNLPFNTEGVKISDGPP